MSGKPTKKSRSGKSKTTREADIPRDGIPESPESHPGLALLEAIDPSDMIISGGEKGIYSVPMSLSPDLEEERDELEAELIRAQELLNDFAAAHGWMEHLADPFMHRAEIFDGQGAFIDGLLAVLGRETDPPVLPDAVSAALEEGILMAVSPAAYAMIYPQGIEEDSYARLLAHEMAHRLHIRILGGNEEAMGPVWFYEGFAIVAAGQFRQRKPKLSGAEAAAIVRREARGDYRAYASVMDMILQKKSLAELVDSAGQPGFSEDMANLLATC